MRELFAQLVGAFSSDARVLELGSGPGLLAEAVLQACRNVASYTLLDFSPQMLELSRQRLAQFRGVDFIHGDFKQPDWLHHLSARYSAVVAMQAVHEIRHKRHVLGLYQRVRDLLEPGGLLAVCDGVPRDPSLFQQNLYMSADEQLGAFALAGFERVRLEKQIGHIILVTGRAPA